MGAVPVHVIPGIPGTSYSSIALRLFTTTATSARYEHDLVLPEEDRKWSGGGVWVEVGREVTHSSRSVVTDSTHSPLKKQRFFLTGVSWLLDTRKDYMKNTNLLIFLLARGTVFQDVRPGAGFETGDFGKEMLEGLPWNHAGGR